MSDTDTLFVDLCDPRESRIPGTKHCPRDMLEFLIDPDRPYHKPEFASDRAFVFFCARGWHLALAAKAAQEMELERVRHLEESFKGLKEAGLTVDCGFRFCTTIDGVQRDVVARIAPPIAFEALAPSCP